MKADNIHDFIFGNGCLAGIGPISGDAGCDVDTEMSFDEFIDIVEVFLDDDQDLTKEFSDPDVRRELYAEFQATYADIEAAMSTENKTITAPRFRFAVYFTGEPPVKQAFSYDDNYMYLETDDAEEKWPLFEEEHAQLTKLHAADSLTAAALFHEFSSGIYN